MKVARNAGEVRDSLSHPHKQREEEEEEDKRELAQDKRRFTTGSANSKNSLQVPSRGRVSPLDLPRTCICVYLSEEKQIPKLGQLHSY